MRNVLKISPDDSVAVALTPLKAGDAIEVDRKTITLLDDIPAGHKAVSYTHLDVYKRQG